MADELGLQIHAEQVAAEMGINRDGTVSPEEFEAWVKRQTMRRRKHTPKRPLNRAETDSHGLYVPRPREATKETELHNPRQTARTDLAHGTNAAAWAAFRKLDKNGSGTLDRDEFVELSDELNLNLSKNEINDAWRQTLDPCGTGVVSFDDFSVFYNSIRTKAKIRLLRKADSWFERVDSNRDGRTNSYLAQLQLVCSYLQRSKLYCAQCPLRVRLSTAWLVSLSVD